ncbi:MAG: 50S ribosomal protein L21 [Anaerovoracaceae bacterium]
MYAVVETGGKQYRVQEGDVIAVEKLDVAVGEKITFDKVLLISDGEKVKVGAPYVESCNVAGTVVEHGKAKKVIIFKYKAKKDYRKKQGHRQPYTMIKIEKVSARKARTTKAAAEATEAAAE